jgi:hypothetical protein
MIAHDHNARRKAPGRYASLGVRSPNLHCYTVHSLSWMSKGKAVGGYVRRLFRIRNPILLTLLNRKLS